MRLPLPWISCVDDIRLNGVYNLLLWTCPYSGSVRRVFNIHVLLSCASSMCTPFSFLITSRHFSFSLPIFRCPLTSIFYDLITTHLHQAFFPRDLTISVSLLLFLTYVCNTCICSYFFIPDLLNPRYSHHPCQHSHFCYS